MRYCRNWGDPVYRNIVHVNVFQTQFAPEMSKRAMSKTVLTALSQDLDMDIVTEQQKLTAETRMLARS